ncbi:H-2 class II histocompatibility antigen, A-U alpha chain-like isoform X1 [Hoplias malabaricus]|uniref:H-2 class II histocompatibility antigen, A-U alpha chain-like isoform X1 n=1 Tax=Hoplias malabaricus TaxID=27720 RepID=UPI003463653F
MDEMLTLIVHILTVGAVGSQLTGFHRFGLIQGCDESSYDFSAVFDGEKLVYYDYVEERTVSALPEFADPAIIPDFSKEAKRWQNTCKQLLDIVNQGCENPPEELEAPWVSLYSKMEVKLRVSNSLVCRASSFFPQPVTVFWTKNNLNVTEGVSLGPYYQNSDGTLSVFSTLGFTPELGDIYSCTVEHRALEGPQTRIWEVDTEVEEPSVFATVLCVVELCLGISGIIAGVVLIIKGKQTLNS